MEKQISKLKKQTVKLLEKRLKHQQTEVKEAKKNLGKPGFSKQYLLRMEANAKQTEKMLNKLIK